MILIQVTRTVYYRGKDHCVGRRTAFRDYDDDNKGTLYEEVSANKYLFLFHIYLPLTLILPAIARSATIEYMDKQV